MSSWCSNSNYTKKNWYVEDATCHKTCGLSQIYISSSHENDPINVVYIKYSSLNYKPHKADPPWEFYKHVQVHNSNLNDKGEDIKNNNYMWQLASNENGRETQLIQT